MQLQFVAIIILNFMVPGFELKKMFELSIKSFRPMPESKPDFINFGDVRLSRKARNSFVISGSFSVFKNIGNEFKAKFEASRKDNGGVYRVYMGGNKNVCDFFQNEKVTYPDLVKVSNLPDPNLCPFPKGNYTIDSFVQDEAKLPELIPAGEWLLKVWFETDNEIYGGYLTDATVKY